MRKAAVLLMAVLALGAGCANYVTTSELAHRLDGRVTPGDVSGRSVVTGSGHEITVEQGTRVVIVDGRSVVLRHPARVERGALEVSDELLQYLPAETVRPVVPAPGTMPAPRRVTHVVIDPGHGGENLGADYGGLQEKTVNLDIARELAAELGRCGMQVTLTRDSDVFVPLDERSQIANRAAADLFVSIHANAAANGSARGIELFYLAETFTDDARRFDDTSRALALNAGTPDRAVTAATLERGRREGRELARQIDRTMRARLAAPSRGVRPAGFAVLKWTSCPAVLVEVGFLSNSDDRRLLSTAAYRTRVALAVAEGILSYSEHGEETP